VAQVLRCKRALVNTFLRPHGLPLAPRSEVSLRSAMVSFVSPVKTNQELTCTAGRAYCQMCVSIRFSRRAFSGDMGMVGRNEHSIKSQPSSCLVGFHCYPHLPLR
jgi:hypothetical protein